MPSPMTIDSHGEDAVIVNEDPCKIRDEMQILLGGKKLWVKAEKRQTGECCNKSEPGKL